eukprot:485989-Ditylum_brightwellii.AAC.1
MWGLVDTVDLVVAVVFAVFGAVAMASLALAKRLFATQLIVAFVVLNVVCVIIVDVVVEVVMPVLVAAAMASLALAKCPFTPARHYISFCMYL